MIFSYNKQGVGDVLTIVVANVEDKAVHSESKGNVTRIYVVETNQTVGLNVFQVSEVLTDIVGNGQVFLSDSQLETVNEMIRKAGFENEKVSDSGSKMIIGYVKECVAHPDSDHLSVTQTEVDNGQVVQIVCGASNIAAGQKVVVAKPGAMMPDGLIIWAGSLRGVESFGMICSAKELGLPNASQEKGILVLPEDSKVGSVFL